MFHKQLALQPLTSKQFTATAMSHKQLAQRLHAHKQIGQHSRLAARAKSREFSSPRLLGRNKEFHFCTSQCPQASTAPIAFTRLQPRMCQTRCSCKQCGNWRFWFQSFRGSAHPELQEKFEPAAPQIWYAEQPLLSRSEFSNQVVHCIWRSLCINATSRRRIFS